MKVELTSTISAVEAKVIIVIIVMRVEAIFIIRTMMTFAQQWRLLLCTSVDLVTRVASWDERRMCGAEMQRLEVYSLEATTPLNA